LVRQRYSTTHPDEATRYAVGLPHHTASGGGVVLGDGGKPGLRGQGFRSLIKFIATRFPAAGVGGEFPASPS
jgi:hypothetical protein